MKENGRFQIIKRLGRGGMATVYLASDPTTRRLVAIGLLTRHFMHEEGFQLRFCKGAKGASCKPLGTFG